MHTAPCHTRESAAVPQQPPGRREGVAADVGVGASEHDGQQGCSACSQAVPYNDQPVFLKDRSRMRRGHKTKQRMMENERKEKGQSHGSDAEGLAENPVADEASVQVLGSLRNPLETEAAAMMAGQDRLSRRTTGCPALACDCAPSESSVSGSGRAHCSCISGTWCGGG